MKAVGVFLTLLVYTALAAWSLFTSVLICVAIIEGNLTTAWEFGKACAALMLFVFSFVMCASWMRETY